MAESEYVKIALNNGFMLLFAVWVLFRGEPKYREAVTKIAAANASAIKALSEDNRHTLDAMRAAFAETVETVSAKFESIITGMHKECREERNDILTRMLANDDKDREARHKQGDLFQKAIAEMQEYYGGRSK